MERASNKKYQFLISFFGLAFILAFIALGSMGGCDSNGGGGKNKEGCCVVAGGDLCFGDFNKDECDVLDGDLKKGKMCDDVPECGEPPIGEGCCVFGDNDCEDGLGQEGCELDGGVFDAEVMCMDVAECNPEPLDGALLYMDNCQACHGPNGDGSGSSGINVEGKSAQEIIDANMQFGLSLEQVEAIAVFLGM